jgi:hypothetical protein
VENSWSAALVGCPLKKQPHLGLPKKEPACSSEGMEEQIGVETVELDHDAGRDREPDCREYRGSGQKLLHVGGGAGGFSRMLQGSILRSKALKSAEG